MSAYFVSDNIITSLGFTTQENIFNIKNNVTGVRTTHNDALYPSTVCISQVDTEKLDTIFAAIGNPEEYTRFEKLIIASVTDALRQCKINVQDKKTLLLISTTKGNIDLLEPKNKGRFGDNRIFLWESARLIGRFFNNPNKVHVISNACISGVLAIISAMRMLQSGEYDNVIVSGADIASEFIVAGFESFKSLSPEPCKPFDASRNGLSLGEGAGTVILSSNPGYCISNACAETQCLMRKVQFQGLRSDKKAEFTGVNEHFFVRQLADNEENGLSGQTLCKITITGGASANDANHISGPSRTGEGSYLAITAALKEAELNASAIDYISAHGTATPYNDEMEAVALSRANLLHAPVNSFKGYWGHTLGAAGIIESAATIYSMRNNVLLKSYGYAQHGVTQPVKVIETLQDKMLSNCLKIASGFGGCNAAAVFSKVV